MDADDGSAMDETEIESVLGTGGTGVLAVAMDDVPYATPVSYGYHHESKSFYFRLGFGESSRKSRFVEAGSPATFVVYDRLQERWYSVVARGTLEPITADEITTDIANHLRRGELPLVEVWDEPAANLEFELYRMAIDDLSGRTA